MAKMTASDFVSYVRQDLGGIDSNLMSDTRILRLVNQAYILDVASVFDLPELETSTTLTLSSGTAEYDFSVSDILRVISVTDTTNAVDLTNFEISRKIYQLWTQGGTVSGSPSHWFLSGVSSSGALQLTVYPTPSAAATLSVVYRKKPSELVTSPAATSTILQYQWDDVIHSFAVARGWRSLGDLQKWAGWRAEAKELAIQALNATDRVATVVTEFTGGAEWNIDG